MYRATLTLSLMVSLLYSAVATAVSESQFRSMTVEDQDHAIRNRISTLIYWYNSSDLPSEGVTYPQHVKSRRPKTPGEAKEQKLLANMCSVMFFPSLTFPNQPRPTMEQKERYYDVVRKNILAHSGSSGDIIGLIQDPIKSLFTKLNHNVPSDLTSRSDFDQQAWFNSRLAEQQPVQVQSELSPKLKVGFQSQIPEATQIASERASVLSTPAPVFSIGGQTPEQVGQIIRNVTFYIPRDFIDLRKNASKSSDGNIFWKIEEEHKENFAIPGGDCGILFDAAKSEYTYQCYFPDVTTVPQLKAKMDLLRAATAVRSGWTLDPPERRSAPIVDFFKAKHPKYPGAHLVAVGTQIETEVMLSFVLGVKHPDSATPLRALPETQASPFVGKWTGQYRCENNGGGSQDIVITEPSPGNFKAKEHYAQNHWVYGDLEYNGHLDQSVKESPYLVLECTTVNYQLYLKFDGKMLLGNYVNHPNACKHNFLYRAK